MKARIAHSSQEPRICHKATKIQQMGQILDAQRLVLPKTLQQII